jgi:hypothetical protein
MRAEWRDEPARGAISLIGPGRYAQLYFPAIAVPLGPADEILCPPDHVEHVREVQRNAPEGLNILVIGYSGIDQEVLSLLAWGGRQVASLLVVNGNREGGWATVETFSRELGFAPTEEMVFPGGFTDFAQTDAMETFLRAIPG